MSFYHSLICMLDVLKFLWHPRLSCLNNNPLAAPLIEDLRVKPCLNKSRKSLFKDQQPHFGGSGVDVIISYIPWRVANVSSRDCKTLPWRALALLVSMCRCVVTKCGMQMWPGYLTKPSTCSMTILHHPRHHGHKLEDLHHLTRVRATRI